MPSLFPDSNTPSLNHHGLQSAGNLDNDCSDSICSFTSQHIEENLSLVNGELLNNIKNKYEIKYNRLHPKFRRQSQRRGIGYSLIV